MFTRRPLAGNQLAVFPEATGLDPALMQRIALEMAFPETTFILPLETDDTDVRMRIFTPRRELPLTAEPTNGRDPPVCRSRQPLGVTHVAGLLCHLSSRSLTV